MSEAGRNDPCPCGSGKKYKKCCLIATAVEQAKRDAELDAWLEADFAVGQQRLAELEASRATATV